MWASIIATMALTEATVIMAEPDKVRHYIIGTAGHIDHGKTALVRALTGVDTDTQAEEQRRFLPCAACGCQATGGTTSLISRVTNDRRLITDSGFNWRTM